RTFAMTTPSSPPKSTQRTPVIPSFEDLCNSDERDLARLEPSWGKAACWRRLNIDPPCRLNIDPGPVATF
ncbi:MAG: hypothetical protein ABIU05_01555, partial [Nitrospirales bacterium]